VPLLFRAERSRAQSEAGCRAREYEPGLTAPRSPTRTSEELDAELGGEQAGYVECHQALGGTLAAAKAEIEAATNAAQEKARKSSEERKKKAEKSSSEPAEPIPSRVPTATAPQAVASLYGDSQPMTN